MTSPGVRLLARPAPIWGVAGLAFLVTGFDALVFEVLWIRLLSTVFGTTIHAVSTTLAAFLGGLGIGAYVLGGIADRRALGPRELVRLFAALEAGAALLALAICLALPRLQALGALLSPGDPGPATLAGRALVTFALLFAPTFLMGGSLPVLAKAILHVSPGAGRTVGALYAINTLGAALGAVLVDAWLVMQHGIARTAMMAAAGNLAAAAAVLVFIRWPAKGAGGSAQAAAPAPAPAPRARLLLAVYGLSGLAALGYEVVWTRLLMNEVFSSRFAISTMLAVVLGGLVAGSALMAWLLRSRRPIRPLLAGTQLGIGLAAVASLHALERWRPAWAGIADAWTRQAATLDLPGVNLVGVADCLPQVIVLQGIPAILLGAALPLVAEGTVAGARVAGRQVGLIYLWNTLGAIAGALGAGFLLLPRLGAEGTLQLLATLNVLAAMAVLAFLPGGGRLRLVAAPAGAAIAVLLFALAPRDGYLQRKEAAGARTMVPHQEAATLHLSEGLYQTLAVREFRLMGEFIERRLITNSYSMSGTNMEGNRYMRLMAHIPLLLHDAPREAALIAFGVGNTARAIAAHPVERIDVIELSEEVIRLAPYFAHANRNVLEDPRVAVHINDGRNFLLGTGERYDLITFEPPPPGQADVVGLYTREYYELVRERLRPGGAMTQWLPIIQASYPTNLSMIRSVLEAFPHVTLWTGALNELVLLGSLEPFRLDLAAVAERIAARGLTEELAAIGIGSAEDLLATFLGDERWLRQLTRDVPPVTDDNRLLEYDYARKAAEPSSIGDYLALFRSNQFAAGVDTVSQLEARELTDLRLKAFMGVTDLDYAPRFLRLARRPANLYLVDHLSGLPWTAQQGILDPARRRELIETRPVLVRAIWHHLLRNELGPAARLTQAGLERWPEDPSFGQLRSWILETAQGKGP